MQHTSSLARSSDTFHLGGDGPRLAVHRSGASGGPPLVCLHGLSANASSWQPVTDRFGPTWQTFALDFRGHGASQHTPGRYALDGYLDDVDRLLHEIGAPAVVVGHSLGGVVAATLAQTAHRFVHAVVLEDAPLYLVEPAAFADSSFTRGFTVLREHVERLRAESAPVERYRDLLAAAPHPAGDTLGDHLHDDAVWARAGALASMDTDAISATLDGRTFAGYDPDRPLRCPAMVLRADPRFDAGFLPEHEARLRATSPDAEVFEVAGAGHNIRGDRAGRARYLDLLGVFLARHTPRA